MGRSGPLGLFLLVGGWGFPPSLFFWGGGLPVPPSALPGLVHALAGERSGSLARCSCCGWPPAMLRLRASCGLRTRMGWRPVLLGLARILPAGRLRQPVSWGHGSGGVDGGWGASLGWACPVPRLGAGGFTVPAAVCAGGPPRAGGRGLRPDFPASLFEGGGGCTVGRVVGWCGGVPWLWACFFPFRVVRRLDRVRPTVSVLWQKTIEGEGILKAILRHWIRFFRPMVNLHSDRDIRFTGEQGWYLNAFRAMGVEVSYGQPYRPQSTDCASA